MAMPDEMGVEFTAVELGTITSGIQQAITAIINKKVVQLTAQERQGGQSVAETRQPYVHKAIDNLAPTYPALQPNFLPLTGAQTDLRASEQMNEAMLLSMELLDRIIDFGLASEHFAYQYTRKFYAIAKEAQGTKTPGADTVVDELKGLFEGQGQTNPPAPTPGPVTPA
jgi:hypothetical protein